MTTDPDSTVHAALAWGRAHLRELSPTARLDAELLLAHVLGWGRARLLAEGRMPLPKSALSAYQALIARRANLEPVAYIVGKREFYGLDFFVNPHVLIPRPETELLVELAIGWVRGQGSGVRGQTADRQTSRRQTADQATRGQGSGVREQMEDWQTSRQGDKQTPMLGEQEEHIEHCSLATHHSSLDSTQNSKLKAQTLKAADICTGSGCIAVALAKHLPEALVIATDIDTQALELARRNIQHHGMSERIQLLQGDLLDALPEPVDLLVSNPPYTIFDTIDEGVRRHEPRLALDGGRDGLDFYRRLLAEAPHKLCANATILLEIGADQGQAVLELASSTFPQASISIHRDLAGHERVVMVATAQTESRRRRQADADC